VWDARRLCGREQEGGSNLDASTDTRQEEAFRDINLIFRSISSVLRIRTLILIRKRIEVLEPNRNLKFSYLLVFHICHFLEKIRIRICRSETLIFGFGFGYESGNLNLSIGNHNFLEMGTYMVLNLNPNFFKILMHICFQI
jgi:hypothetical protein